MYYVIILYYKKGFIWLAYTDECRQSGYLITGGSENLIASQSIMLAVSAVSVWHWRPRGCSGNKPLCICPAHSVEEEDPSWQRRPVRTSRVVANYQKQGYQPKVFSESMAHSQGVVCRAVGRWHMGGGCRCSTFFQTQVTFQEPNA